MLGLLRGIVPATPGAPSATAAPSSPPTAKASTVATLALLAIAIGGVSLAPACHTAGPVVASGIVASFDCEAAHFAPQDLIDATKLADAEVQHWLAGGAAASTTAIKADLEPFKSDLLKCALAGALALATGALAPPSSSATPVIATQSLSARTSFAPVSAADPVQVRAAFGAAARELGWAPVRLAGGAVL